MSCGCHSGKSCGCSAPFPWHKDTPPPAVQHFTPATKRCPPGSSRRAVLRMGKMVVACVPNRRVGQPGLPGINYVNSGGFGVGGTAVTAVAGTGVSSPATN